MSEDYKIQVSVKLADYADPMVNIRANDGAEFDSLLTFVTERAPKIAEAIEALRATSVVAKALPVASASVTLNPAVAEQSQPAQGWNTQAQTPPPQWVPQATQQAPAYAPAQTGQYQQPQYQGPVNSARQPGPAPACPHGQMTWRADNKSNPPRWGGFFCPAQKADPSKCATQYAFSER